MGILNSLESEHKGREFVFDSSEGGGEDARERRVDKGRWEGMDLGLFCEGLYVARIVNG